MLKKLSEFHYNDEGIIKIVKGEGRVRRRLFDMGVTPGAMVMLRKKAPLGDPLEFTLRGYELTLRKAEADLVMCEVTKEGKKK
jgi:Fe2+ transport system protein FeoA